MRNRSSQWFMGPTPVDKSTKELHVRFVESLIRYSRRWKVLSLSHLPPHALALFSALTSVDMPLLEEFRDPEYMPHTFSTSNSDTQFPPLLTTVGTLPSIRNLWISAREGLPPDIQWSQLTVLKLSHSTEHFESVSTLQRISRLCPLLSECTLSSLRYSDASTETSRMESQEWGSLQKLDLTLTGPNSASFTHFILTLFGSITVPALTDLSLLLNCYLPLPQAHLAPDDFPSPQPVRVDQAIEDIVVRSQCDIARLDLTIPSWDNLGTMLDGLPSLTTLDVDPSFSVPLTGTPSETPPFQTIAETLMPSAGSIRCPRLEKFSITNCLARNAMALVDLADTRARTTPLQLLRAKFGCLSAAQIGSLKLALELGKSKGLGGKIRWQFTRQDPANYFDDPRPFAAGDPALETLSA
ncbi:hypothetical protein V5O48_007773 [Marasmius crinis-equi]|uniref:Uncharacterized protein n=1 Tax=Marasmius crinis-equi TaxID=585013 RepID=A0ABR3FFY2_9AGAR